MKLVFIGGGTGLSCLAHHAAELWKEHPSAFSQLTVIQHPYDDGGHSGVLVREEGILPPGDFRKSILALSKPFLDGIYRKIALGLEHRNKKGEVVANSFMAAIAGRSETDPGKGLLDSIEALSAVVRLPKQFRVVPVSLDKATLCATLADGSRIEGQAKITQHHDFGARSIRSMELVPPEGLPKPRLYEEARKAIMMADKILLCSGSFRTSFEPNPLVEGCRGAMMATKAKIFLAINLLTKASETSGWNSKDFIERTSEAIGGRVIDVALYNRIAKMDIPEGLREEVIRHFEKKVSFPVKFSKSLRALVILEDGFAHWDGESLYHNELTVRRILGL